MLLGYGAKNCWCFKDWMKIDLSLDNKVPSDVSMKLPASTVICFKGANASGKTNALKVFSFITDFATNSFQYKLDSEIFFDTYFMNDDPAEFYIEFLVEGTYYCYEFKVYKKKIVEEHLSRKLGNQGSRIAEVFTRAGNRIIKNSLYSGHNDIIFRDNASFISTLCQYGIREINDVYNFLHNDITYIGLNNKLIDNINNISRLYYNSLNILTFVQEKIHMFDTGISQIKIMTRKNEQNNNIYFPVFYHVREGQDDVPFTLEQESSGTRKLFSNLLFYAQVLESGRILVLDDLDINLHSDILPYLLELFIKHENNPNNAQLIFTAHNNEIMDILSKYRIYLFEKENGESYCYRLDEISLRNDRSISIPYKKGLIGGVPKIE